MQSSWNDHFIDEEKFNVWFEKQYSIIASSNAVYVHCCYFENIIHSTSNGGCILFSTTTQCAQLLIEHSFFSNCTITGTFNGGSINMSPNGQCVLFGVCAEHCQCEEDVHGQFNNIEVTDNSNYKNEIIE